VAEIDPALFSLREPVRTNRRRFLGGSAGAAAAVVLGEPSVTACSSEPKSSLAAALQYQTASDITARIVGGDLSAKQVAEHTLDRISDINPRLNAVVALARDEMLRAAENVDRRYPDYASAKFAQSVGEPTDPPPSLARLLDWLPPFIVVTGIVGWVTEIFPDAVGIALIAVGSVGSMAMRRFFPDKGTEGSPAAESSGP
jgi:hypothetical protein